MVGGNARRIISRRTRPAKAPLSREVIVTTALEILERGGLSNLSLRRIAAVLDTGAASLYVYVEDLAALHALMLDEALATAKPAKTRNGSWRDRLKEFLLSYLHELLKRPGLAQLALSIISTGPNAMRIREQLFGLLKEGGVEDARAAWGVDLLTLYATTIAAEQDKRRAAGHGLGGVRKALSAAAEVVLPLTSPLKETQLAGDSEAHLHWALDVILNGFERTKEISCNREG